MLIKDYTLLQQSQPSFSVSKPNNINPAENPEQILSEQKQSIRDNDNDIAATLETNISPKSTERKAILYTKEQFARHVQSSSVQGNRIDLSSHIRDMKRTEAEFLSNDSHMVSDEAMDAFLKKAFKLFDL